MSINSLNTLINENNSLDNPFHIYERTIDDLDRFTEITARNAAEAELVLETLDKGCGGRRTYFVVRTH